MKSPKMPGPSAAEIQAQQDQAELIAKQKSQLDAEEKARKAEQERSVAAIAGNRVGVRSLLSNDWGGFARSGDLGARP